jgi:hypothetical protein
MVFPQLATVGGLKLIHIISSAKIGGVDWVESDANIPIDVPSITFSIIKIDLINNWTNQLISLLMLYHVNKASNGGIGSVYEKVVIILHWSLFASKLNLFCIFVLKQ